MMSKTLCRSNIRYALIGMLAMLLLPAVQASAAPLSFTPGHYVGFTSQTCPAEPVPVGSCQAGQKLPISFTISSSSVSKLEVVVVDACEDGLPSVALTMHEPRKWDLAIQPRRGVFIERPDIYRHSSAAADNAIIGMLRGDKASGVVQSLVTVNPSGQIDPSGTAYCQAKVHWQAVRK